MTGVAVREARPEDALACATILNTWIDATDWMPRVHPADDVERHYRDVVFQKREVWVTGDPVDGYLALDVEGDEITSLYAAKPGNGIGKTLVDHAKSRYGNLTLWTFEANHGARRFYVREGFHEAERSAGDNEEGLPDIRFVWARASIRRAVPEDVPVISRIVNDWVDRTPWNTRKVAPEVMTDQIRTAMPDRDMYLIGDPAVGYLSLNPETNLVGAIYVDQPGQGFGKALLDRAKRGRDYLQLWTHEPNVDAQKFYAREGFKVVERNPEGADGLPELRLEWRA